MFVFQAIFKVDEYSATAPPFVPVLLRNETNSDRVTVLKYAVKAVV